MVLCVLTSCVFNALLLPFTFRFIFIFARLRLSCPNEQAPLRFLPSGLLFLLFLKILLSVCIACAWGCLTILTGARYSFHLFFYRKSISGLVLIRFWFPSFCFFNNCLTGSRNKLEQTVPSGCLEWQQMYLKSFFFLFIPSAYFKEGSPSASSGEERRFRGIPE